MAGLNLNSFLDTLGFQGDPRATSVGDSISSILETLQNYGPQYFNLVNSNIPATSAAQYAASKLVSQPTGQLNLDVTREIAPQLAQVENQISRDRKLSDAQGDLAVLQGPGAELAKAATNLGATVVDPQFYATRAAVGNKSQELVNSLDPNKLSGGERTEVERSLNADANRTGNVGNDVGINTVNNAMHYGDKLNAKRAQIGNTLGTITSGLQNLRSGVDYFGKPQTSTPYTSSFQAVTKPDTTGADTANNLLNQSVNLKQQQNQINSERRDSLDRVTGILDSIP